MPARGPQGENRKMKMLAFTVYDEKSEAFAQPFFTTAIGVASRMFSEWANDDTILIGRHPEDYTLYHVGYFETHDAKMSSNDTPSLIGKATDYRKIKGLREAKANG